MCRFYCQCLFRTWSRTTLLWLALILCDLMPVPTPWRKKNETRDSNLYYEFNKNDISYQSKISKVFKDKQQL